MGKGTGAMRTTIQLELDRLHEERMISVTKDEPEVSDPLRREMVEITMRQMLEAGVHFGHRTRFWSPKMSPYIFGSRNKIHIIHLEKTM